MDKTQETEIEKADRWKIQRLVRKTQSKDRKAARNSATALLKEFIFAYEKRPHIEPELLKYFATCFQNYLVEYECNNDYWPEAMNTRGESGQVLGAEERNRKLHISYAIHLRSKMTKESFIEQIVSNPPDYWVGRPPSRDTLLKLLPAQNSEIMSHYLEVIEILLPSGSRQED